MKELPTAAVWAGARFLAVAALVASTSACGVLPGSSTIAGGVPTTVPFEVLDGYALGPTRTVTGDAFHRLEVTARDTWRASHPEDTLSGFELRAPAIPASSRTTPDTVLEFLVVVTVVRGDRHVVAVHCDPSTFPADGSCS